MAPPPNRRRRAALADAALAVLARDGVHGLSHRAVDEAAGLPAGTTSNYFRDRDALLGAAAERVLELHRADMEAAHEGLAGLVDSMGLVDLVAMSLLMSATVLRERYLAVYELTLESVRRPALARTFEDMRADAVEFTLGQHRMLGLSTSREDVATLVTLFGGALCTLVTGQAGPVTEEVTRGLARTMVRGIGTAAEGD